MLPEAAVAHGVAVASVEHHNMTCAAAAAAVVLLLLRVKGALGFVKGRRSAESAGVERRGTAGACRSE